METKWPRDVIYTGRPAAATEAPDGALGRHRLHAGPLTLVLDGMDLRYIRLGEREVLRRIYVAVRDRNWNTIPAVYTNVHLSVADDGFALSFDARHQAGEIDFAWHGIVQGTAEGTIRYTMDGAARRSFWKNRIGFCVLHPLDCAGLRCTVWHVDGTVEHGTFPAPIAPHQPFVEFDALAHQIQPGLDATVRLEGDVFEMEDQRNWTDASFKTYSTPLRLPFPVEVAEGERIAQACTLSFQGAHPPVSARVDNEVAVHVAINPAVSYPLPRLGVALASHGGPPSRRETTLLHALRPAHLRVDLDLTRPAYETALRQAVEQSRALDAPLELALCVSDDAARELAELDAAVRRLQPRVARWLIFHHGEPVTSSRWVQLARGVLGPYQPDAPVGGGSNAYFAQLNRNRPAPDVLDVVSYSINPQVHAFDNASLVETLAAQAVTLQSARQFSGRAALAVSPVTLKPRFNPDATAPEPPPRPGELPAQVDPRQMSLFGAGWTVGSIKYLAAGGADGVTYYETTGWRGVMETETGPAEPAAFPSAPGMVFPLYHVLTDVQELAGAAVLESDSSHPLLVEALVLGTEGGIRVLLANLTDEPRDVTVQVPGAWSARLRVLDEHSYARAVGSPTAFRGESGEELAIEEGTMRLTLLPYAVTRIHADVDDQPDRT